MKKGQQKKYNFLALGDSYTIGEGVALTESFPYQTVQWLRRSGQPFSAPEVIARTGWTTDELAAAMRKIHWLRPYDFVSLLIGVNNQYRERPAADFFSEFEGLLQAALELAGGSPPQSNGGSSGIHENAGRVFVLSIPDWSVTPFAKHGYSGTDKSRLDRIASEIDAYNQVARSLCAAYAVAFIDITGAGRLAGDDPSGYTADGLHPAAGQLRGWSALLAEHIMTALTRNSLQLSA